MGKTSNSDFRAGASEFDVSLIVKQWERTIEGAYGRVVTVTSAAQTVSVKLEHQHIKKECPS